MANSNLFKSAQKVAPVANDINNAGGKAYSLSDKQALAQFAVTNTFNGTYYTTAEHGLDTVKNLVNNLKSDPEFIAKVALYAYEKGNMKDMSAYLCVVLAELDTKLFRKVFRRITTNGKMLRNVVQIARSGQAGRVRNMSSGTYFNALQEWFNAHSAEEVFRASVGNDPSMRDILRMVRPRPATLQHEAVFGYIVGKVYKYDNLPVLVQQYEAYKVNKGVEVPAVDFRLLDSLGLGEAEWTEIARNASWQTTRMNLNTFVRHGVFNSKELVEIVANRLRDGKLIAKAKVFPYQLLAAYINVNDQVPHEVREALQDAMELSVANTPAFPGKVYVAVDTSGSMGSSITGYRRGSTSKVRCVDVAALFASCVLRKNGSAEVLPFDTIVHNVRLNPRDSIMSNAQTLARFGGGGTNCAAAIEYLNDRNLKGDAIVFVSDNESWVDSLRQSYYTRIGTGMMVAWMKFKQRNPKAKLVCIDLTPGTTSQVTQHQDILQVGGFSDQVFDVVNSFLDNTKSDNHWVETIERVEV